MPCLIYYKTEPRREVSTANEDNVGRDVLELWLLCRVGDRPIRDLRVQTCVLLGCGSLVAGATGIACSWQRTSAHRRTR